MSLSKYLPIAPPYSRWVLWALWLSCCALCHRLVGECRRRVVSSHRQRCLRQSRHQTRIARGGYNRRSQQAHQRTRNCFVGECHRGDVLRTRRYRRSFRQPACSWRGGCCSPPGVAHEHVPIALMLSAAGSTCPLPAPCSPLPVTRVRTIPASRNLTEFDPPEGDGAGIDVPEVGYEDDGEEAPGTGLYRRDRACRSGGVRRER